MIINCPFCSVTTAGEHEWGCPNSKNPSGSFFIEWLEDSHKKWHERHKNMKIPLPYLYCPYCGIKLSEVEK